MVGTSPLDTSWTCVMKGITGPVTDITLGSRLQSKTWKRKPKPAEEVLFSVPVAVREMG